MANHIALALNSSGNVRGIAVIVTSSPLHSTFTTRDVKASICFEHAMPNPPPTPLTFYPAYCFSLSPTHNTWARLTAAQVHALRGRTGFEGTHVLSCFSFTHSPLTCVLMTRDAEFLVDIFSPQTSRSKSLLPPQPPHQMDPPRRCHRRARPLPYALDRAAR